MTKKQIAILTGIVILVGLVFGIWLMRALLHEKPSPVTWHSPESKKSDSTKKIYEKSDSIYSNAVVSDSERAVYERLLREQIKKIPY